ncbi:MAG: DUF4932 domain-containing protein [Planctomycetota bacterium]
MTTARRIVTSMTLACLATTPALAGPPAATSPIEVVVDPRVELMSLIFRLAGNNEYTQARVPSYAADADAWFEEFHDHAVVQTAKRLRRTRGVSYDAVMSMAVHFTDTDALDEVVPLDPHPPGLDTRWTLADARQFLDEARQFARDADFQGFFDDHRDLYATTVERFEKVLSQEGVLEWFNAFYGARPGARFTIALGMLNGGACYAARVLRDADDEDLYCVLGVWETDERGLPHFHRGMLGTVVHEFSHSYVNPIVYRNTEALEQAGTTLYPLVADEMRQQAYGNWVTMMHESLVRASVVRFALAKEGTTAAEQEIRRQVDRSFHWMPQLAALLGEYEGDRERYPDLEAFLPRIVAFFSDFAPRFAEEMAALEAHRPRVVRMTPPNGATDVDPDLEAIVIEFDRPMKLSWSVVGGGPAYPPSAGDVSFDESRTVLTMPVRLEPEHSYEFWLNRRQYKSFRSAEGAPLESVHVTFRTAARRGG